MILTKFFRTSLHQIEKAHLSNSDKIDNLIEMLEPYHLQHKVTGVYSASQMMGKLSNLYNNKHLINDKTFNKDKDMLEPYLHAHMLDSKHYFVFKDAKYNIKGASKADTKKVEAQVVRILKHSNK